MSPPHQWPSLTELLAMPTDLLKQWFWKPTPAVTAEQQKTLRAVAERLFTPPKIAPVYIPAPEPKTAKDLGR